MPPQASTVDVSNFNRGLAGFVDKLGLPANVVFKKECGELLKTLIKLTPPSNAAASRARIARVASTKFDAASQADYIDSRLSPGGVRWTRHTRAFLYGVAKELDWRNETDVRKIAALSKQLRPTGRRILDFVHPRKRQRVALSQRVFLQAGMLAQTIKYMQRHVGRLKAGWLASWDRLAPTGGKTLGKLRDGTIFTP